MKRNPALMALGLLLVVGGVLGAAVTSFSANLAHGIGGMYDQRLLPLAIVIVAATVAAGISLFLRPKLGALLAVAALTPQAISFAVGSVAYAFNLWPNYRVEFGYPFGAGADWALSYSFDTPGWILRTDAHFTGAGVGIDLVATAIILFVVYAYWLQRPQVPRPN
jgi:hypothetical protein